MSHALHACVCTAAFALVLGRARAQAPEPGAIEAPQVVQRVEAIYPEAALAARQEATVSLLVTIGVDGSVSEVSVVESAGDAFDSAAIDAVKQ
jgi:outer membrane biosynthesis protein TonB